VSILENHNRRQLGSNSDWRIRDSAALERGLISHLKGMGYLAGTKGGWQDEKVINCCAHDNNPDVTSGLSWTGFPWPSTEGVIL
jgi:hypothetical protein